MADDKAATAREALRQMVAMAGDPLPATLGEATGQVILAGSALARRIEAKAEVTREDAEATLEFTRAIIALAAVVARGELTGELPGLALEAELKEPRFAGSWGPLRRARRRPTRG